jgi:hypothetical protein
VNVSSLRQTKDTKAVPQTILRRSGPRRNALGKGAGVEGIIEIGRGAEANAEIPYDVSPFRRKVLV